MSKTLFGVAAGKCSNFSELLRDKYSLSLFCEYLLHQHAEESLAFWISVEIYKHIENNDDRIIEARAIFDNYVGREAPHEINVDAAVRERIIVKMREFQVNSALFDEVQQNVLELLEYDCFPRFVQWRSTRVSKTVRLQARIAPDRNKVFMDAHLTRYWDLVRSIKLLEESENKTKLQKVGRLLVPKKKRSTSSPRTRQPELTEETGIELDLMVLKRNSISLPMDFQAPAREGGTMSPKFGRVPKQARKSVSDLLGLYTKRGAESPAMQALNLQ